MAGEVPDRCGVALLLGALGAQGVDEPQVVEDRGVELAGEGVDILREAHQLPAHLVKSGMRIR